MSRILFSYLQKHGHDRHLRGMDPVGNVCAGSMDVTTFGHGCRGGGGGGGAMYVPVPWALSPLSVDAVGIACAGPTNAQGERTRSTLVLVPDLQQR